MSPPAASSLTIPNGRQTKKVTATARYFIYLFTPIWHQRKIASAPRDFLRTCKRNSLTFS